MTINDDIIRNDITTFDEIVGNDSIKTLLKDAIKSAKLRNKPLDHIIISGPSGFGKSTLADVIAHEMGVPMEEITCSVKTIGKINIKLMKMKDHSILCLDEVQSLGSIENYESFYKYFDKGVVQFTFPGKQPVLKQASKCTIISITTDLSKIPRPFINRHTHQLRVEHYTFDEMKENTRATALRCFNFILDDEACVVLANSTKGVPREVKNKLTRLRDHLTSNNISSVLTITKQVVIDALSIAQINERGLDSIDREYIRTLFETFNNEATGISSIANQIQVEEKTLITEYEPFLIRAGYISKSKSGRYLTDLGMDVAMELYSESNDN